MQEAWRARPVICQAVFVPVLRALQRGLWRAGGGSNRRCFGLGEARVAQVRHGVAGGGLGDRWALAAQWRLSLRFFGGGDCEAGRVLSPARISAGSTLETRLRLKKESTTVDSVVNFKSDGPDRWIPDVLGIAISSRVHLPVMACLVAGRRRPTFRDMPAGSACCGSVATQVNPSRIAVSKKIKSGCGLRWQPLSASVGIANSC